MIAHQVEDGNFKTPHIAYFRARNKRALFCLFANFFRFELFDDRV